MVAIAGVKPYYQDAAVTIYHGDCRELLPLMPTVDVVFADPPYGVGFKYSDSYDDSAEGYGDLVATFYAQARALAPVMFVTPGMRNIQRYPQATWMLAWGKPGSTRRSDLGGFNEWEPVLVYGKPKRLWNDFKLLPDCVNHARGDAAKHPCPKPLALLTWLLAGSTEPGQTVLDPFMGSGTTLRAAKDLGRRAIGIEIEERYAEIAARRMSQTVMDLGELPGGGEPSRDGVR